MMKTNIKILLIILTTLFACFSGNGDVLLWTVNDSAMIDGDLPITSFISPLPDDEDNWAVARVKVTTRDGTVIYPTLASTHSDPNIPPDYYPGEEGVWIGGGGDFWGADWNQSVLPSTVDSTAVFAIELGINHYNQNTDSIDFELLAITEDYSYDDLERFRYPIADLNPMTATPWIPTEFYTSPEPNTSILFLLGISLLFLKRKKYD